MTMLADDQIEGSFSPAEAAWQHYRETLARQRSSLLQSAFARHPLLRAQGLYFMQSVEASAFNIYVAPRQQYPALYVQSFFMPLELSWGIPNPDFVNHNGFVDGAHHYRIYGNKKNCFWASIQITKGFWGDDVQGNLGNIDFDDVPADADGDFEIFLGPTRPAQAEGKYFFELDPTFHNIMLAMREAFCDWSRDASTDIHIECLDRNPDATVYFCEEELAARIEKARKWVDFCCSFSIGLNKAFAGGADRNQFHETVGSKQAGGSPLGAWVKMFYDIGSDEALVIDMPVVEARYWGIQLASVWGQTTDYSYHQSSLNAAQAQIDKDGRFRAVLSLKDPGVPNWLDPVGVPIGMALLRFYRSKEVPVPDVIRIKLTDLHNHLPTDTPAVTPQQRGVSLESRRVASLRRYGQ
jgi:hypothetical protein